MGKYRKVEFREDGSKRLEFEYEPDTARIRIRAVEHNNSMTFSLNADELASLIMFLKGIYSRAFNQYYYEHESYARNTDTYSNTYKDIIRKQLEDITEKLLNEKNGTTYIIELKSKDKKPYMKVVNKYSSWVYVFNRFSTNPSRIAIFQAGGKFGIIYGSNAYRYYDRDDFINKMLNALSYDKEKSRFVFTIKRFKT